MKKFLKKWKVLIILLLVAVIAAVFVLFKDKLFGKRTPATETIQIEIPTDEPKKTAKKTEEPTTEIVEIPSEEPVSKDGSEENPSEDTEKTTSKEITYWFPDIPEYTGSPYISLGSAEKVTDDPTTYMKLSELDSLGRCGPAEAVVGRETMPPYGTEREAIGQVKPSGWKQAKYPGVINSDPAFAINRTHEIAFCLIGNIGEEQLPKILVTGTRYMNIEMTGHELLVVDYIEDTGNHVWYKVTPRFLGDELVCRGLEMEARSIEDDGLGLNFHVFYYNCQPGIEINYSTGETEYNGIFLDTDSEAVIAPTEEGTEEETEE